MIIQELIHLKESEDNIEFKEAKGGNISYNGGDKPEPKKRRRCIIGYVTALANEGGGMLVFGIKESSPHIVVGSKQCEGNTGKLCADLYRDTGIRVEPEELFDEEENRVLIIHVPSRPIGKIYKFEDVPLMRVGDELKPMSDEQYLKIIQEQEPDFSEKLCEGISISDLSSIAIQKLKEAYTRKQNNPQFLTLSDQQVLIDLNLVINNKVTNAAVILLGNQEVIKKSFPQFQIHLEFRKDESNIRFDQRKTFQGSFYLIIDEIWEAIDSRNGSFPIQEGPYIFDIPYFNSEVIREAINNAVAHRNYRLNSEIVIKQFPSRLDIISPGGFPIGVTLNNLLTTASTPRNRLLTDVLQKTGIVERSGQGVDKIFYQTLSEGKKEPNYSYSDDFQVELRLSSVVEDQAFALFIESVQTDLPDEQKLSVQEIIHLNMIRKKDHEVKLDKSILEKLKKRGLIEQKGKTSGTVYYLSQAYYEFCDEKGKYTKENVWDERQVFSLITQHLTTFEKAKMKDFVDLFDGNLNRSQIKHMVGKFVDRNMLTKQGKGSGTYYEIGEKVISDVEYLSKALKIGIQKLNEERNEGE